MKTKFIKVSVDDRLPEKTDYYFTSKGQLKFNLSKNSWFDLWRERIEGDDLPEWWVLEVPDREDEMRETINLYKECFERFIPTELWDEATEFLSTGNNGLAKDLLRREK